MQHRKFNCVYEWATLSGLHIYDVPGKCQIESMVLFKKENMFSNEKCSIYRILKMYPFRFSLSIIFPARIPWSSRKCQSQLLRHLVPECTDHTEILMDDLQACFSLYQTLRSSKQIPCLLHLSSF